MAEIRDDLILEIDEALRSVNRLGTAIDQALGAARDLQIDDSSFRTIDDRLDSIEQSVARTTDEIATLEVSARKSEASFSGLANELGVSEQAAQALTADILETQQASRRLDDEAKALARSLGLSDEAAGGLARQLQQAARAVDDTADNAQSLQRAIASLEPSADQSRTSFEQLARALDVSEDEARRLSQEILEGQQAAIRLDREATEVAQALGLSEAQAREFVNQLRRAPRELDATNDRIDRINSGLVRFRTLLIGAVAAFGVRGLLNQAEQAIDSFNALNESVNAVNVTFGEGADEIFAFGETAARSAGLARGAFQQAVVPIGALLQNFGFDARQSASAAVVLTQRAADLASVFNTEVSDALDSIGSALRGETEPIRRFGVDVSQAAVSSAALASGLIGAGEELEGAALATARLNEILRQTDRVAGDFARTVEDPANAARVLAAEFENARASIGEALIPAFQDLLALAPELISKIEDLGPAIAGVATAAVQAAPGVVTFLGQVLEAIDELTQGLQLSEVRPQLVEAFEDGTEAAKGFLDILKILAVTPIDQQFNALFRSSAEVEEAMDQVIDAFDRLDDAIEAGSDPTEAFAQALGDVGRETIITSAAIEVFARRAGLAGLELVGFLNQFLNSSQAIGLTADEIQVINNLIARLTFEAGGAEAEWNRFQSALDQSQGFSTVTSTAGDVILSLTDLRDAAAETGVSLADAFAAGVDTGQLFDSLATAEAGVQAFRDRINAIGPTIDPLQGAAEAVDLSVEEFIDNITAQFEQNVEFQAALARLIERGQPALAAALDELGAGALPLVQGFLADVGSAEIAEDIFAPIANQTVAAFENALRQEFTATGFDALALDVEAEMRRAFVDRNFGRLGEEQALAIALGLQSPATATFIRGAGETAGDEFTEGLVEFIDNNADRIGVDSISELSDAIIGQRAEIEEAGRTVADIFSDAFAAGVRFDFDLPTPRFADRPTTPTSGTGPGGVGGVTINQEINTTTEREQTDVARATQLAGATANNIRGVS